MEEIFNIRRFGKYFAADLRRCMYNFGLNVILISLMGVICYMVNATFGLCAGKGWETMGESARCSVFIVAAIVLVITMPARCYGRITDKKKGSAFLMLPASVSEKFLSMIINCLIIIPVVFAVIYMSCDWLLCTVDKTAGTAISDAMYSTGKEIFFGLSEEIPRHISVFSAVDDMFNIILVFLLGALYFKRSKAAKTILTFLGLSIAAGMILSLVMPHLPENLASGTFFSRLLAIDTVIDIAMLCVLLAAVFFRVRTIKH